MIRVGDLEFEGVISRKIDFHGFDLAVARHRGKYGCSLDGFFGRMVTSVLFSEKQVNRLLEVAPSSNPDHWLRVPRVLMDHDYGFMENIHESLGRKSLGWFGNVLGNGGFWTMDVSTYSDTERVYLKMLLS